MASDCGTGLGLALPMPSYAHRVAEERLSLGKRHQPVVETEENFTTVLVVGGKFWIREEFYIFHSIAQVSWLYGRFFSVAELVLEESPVGTE